MVTLREAFLVVGAAALALSSVACTNVSSCSRDPDSLTVPLNTGGSAKEGNTYQSAPIGGPYTYFPPFRTITFEHKLGVAPLGIQFWLAFTPKGTIAPSAGNITEIPAVDDGGVPSINPETISVYNNTCSDFYLWVVLEATGIPELDGGANDAAADADGADDGAAGAGP